MHADLRGVEQFCETTGCKRCALLMYFGQPLQVDGAFCTSRENCTSCLRPGGCIGPVRVDCTKAVATLLNAAEESGGKLNQTDTILLLWGSKFNKLTCAVRAMKAHGSDIAQLAVYWKAMHRKIQPECLEVQDRSEDRVIFRVTADGKRVMHGDAQAMLELE